MLNRRSHYNILYIYNSLLCESDTKRAPLKIERHVKQWIDLPGKTINLLQDHSSLNLKDFAADTFDITKRSLFLNEKIQRCFAILVDPNL